MKHMILPIIAILLLGFISCNNDSENSIDGNFIYKTAFSISIQNSEGDDLGDNINVKDIHMPNSVIPVKAYCQYYPKEGCFYVTYDSLLFAHIEGTFSYENQLYDNLREAVTEVDIEWTNGDLDHVKTSHLASGPMCLITKIWINEELIYDISDPSLSGKIVLIKEENNL